MYDSEDIRAESMIAWWLENEIADQDNIVIKSKGTFERSVAKDVKKVEPPIVSRDEKIVVQLNREGLYDMLPEGLFHRGRRNVNRSVEEAIEQTRQYKAEENEARKFFLPLEQEFYRHKVATERAEVGACMSSIRSQHVNAFIAFWELPGELLSYEQKNFALALLPHVHRIVGDNRKVAMCLQILLGEGVAIRESGCNEEIHDACMATQLGGIILGVDSILEAPSLPTDEGIEVVIGPIKLDSLKNYLTGEPIDQLLNKLYCFLFPAEHKVITSILLEEVSGSFLLTEENYTSRLGFTTVLT